MSSHFGIGANIQISVGDVVVKVLSFKGPHWAFAVSSRGVCCDSDGCGSRPLTEILKAPSDLVFRFAALFVPRTPCHVSGKTACPMQLLKHAPDNRLRQEFPQFARRTPRIPNIPKLTQFRNFRNCLIIRGRQMNSEHSEIAAISEFSEFAVGFGTHHQMSIDLR